jgi:hypothetical protein
VEVPICPDPAHKGSRVTRGGWYGTAPHRRQRWWCDPKSGPRHRFTELFPRQETESCECRACRTRLEPWEGPITPRTYAFPEEQIAYALVRLAQGGTYRGVSFDVRRHANRELPSSAPSATPTRAEGVLIANWLDIYADVVTEPDRITEWPKIIAIDSAAFVVNRGLTAGERFHVFGAVGYERPVAKPQVVLFEPTPLKNRSAWEGFLRMLPGEPEIVISDMDAAIAGAVKAVFPEAEHRWSEFHVKRSLEKSFPEAITKDKEHPVFKALAAALTSPAKWDEFEDAVDDAERAGVRVLGTQRWIKKYRARIYEQTNTRERGPHSTGAMEATLSMVSGRLKSRAARMTNRDRARRLLALFAAEMNGKANEQIWLDRIHAHIEALGGKPPAQGKAHDPAGSRTLLGPVGGAGGSR